MIIVFFNDKISSMKSLVTYLFAVLVIILLTDCAQLSSFQTAKVVGKDNGEIGFAGGGTGFAGLIEEGDGTTTTPVLPILELWGRYGVSDKVDIGLKLSTGLSGVIDAKYQFVGDQHSEFAMAIGGGLGFQGGTLESALLQAHLPLHTSWHPSDRFALFLTPRFISQFVIGDGSLNYGGASFGLETGQKIKFVADFSYFGLINNVDDVDNGIFGDLGVGLFQFGIGMKFRLGDN